MPPQQAYAGFFSKLVLAFDVGTTFSGVSYCFLLPGEVPSIQGVNRFPGQEHVGGGCKIPSSICYDQEGTVRAVGAEATQENIQEEIEDSGWVKLEWWKLHLCPRTIAHSHVTDEDIPPLPRNKTAVRVLADFIQYLYKCARKYIEEGHANGKVMLRSFEHTTEFVLSYPNGWEGPHQMQIRNAVIMAGLVPDTREGRSRIHLVTEAEASLHYCFGSGPAAEGFQDDHDAIIVDAGERTINLSAYHTAATPACEEITPPECRFEGSDFVNCRARKMLQEKLRGSQYGSDDMISRMVASFDRTTKLQFSSENDPAFIKFGTVRDRELNFNIRCGQLKLMGSDVASLFEPSAAAIIETIENMRHTATRTINTVFVVGCFAASEWFFARLQNHFRSLGLNLCRPDGHTSNVVACGAVAYMLDHRVSTRVAPFTYGTRYAVEFDSSDPQHKLRANLAIPRPSGRTVLLNAFNVILKKGTVVSETKEFRKEFITEVVDHSACNAIATEVVCYKGNSPEPRWTDSEPGMFSTLCHVHADTSKVASTMSTRRGYAGLQFYRQQFSIILIFGLTEMQAQLCWEEDGIERRSPATVVFDQVIEALRVLQVMQRGSSIADIHS